MKQKSGFSGWFVLAVALFCLYVGSRVGVVRGSNGVTFERGKDMDYLRYKGWRFGVPHESAVDRVARVKRGGE